MNFKSKGSITRISAFLATFVVACGLVWSQNRNVRGGGGTAPQARSAPAGRAAPQARPAPPSAPARSFARPPAPYAGARGAAPTRQAPGVYAGRGQGVAPSGRQPGGATGAGAAATAASRFSTPSRTVTTSTGVVAKMDSAGSVTSIRGNGVSINEGARGERTVISQRADQSRLVSTGAGHGFVEHATVENGRPYIQRTYVANGRTYARVFRGAYYNGFLYYHYVPAWIFAPGFWWWAFNPWRFPVFFNWGWGPWFGWYAYYFAPYPYYFGASMWLTDYILSADLQDAYNAGYNAGWQSSATIWPAESSYAPLTPELKQAIDDEVSAELARQANAAANPQVAGGEEVPAALDPKIRTFIVSIGLTEKLPSGAECFLAPGDVLSRIDDTPDANRNVRVMVSSSQANDCPAGSQLMIGVQELQEMYNAFQQKLEAGLNKLSQTQGKNGIPAGPAANPKPSPEGTAQPDPSAAAQLEQQQKAANQAEQEVAAQRPD